MFFLHSRFGLDVVKSVILSGYGIGVVCARLIGKENSYGIGIRKTI